VGFLNEIRITPGPPLHFYHLLKGRDCGRFIMDEGSTVEELRGEIADLRREVYQQRTCLVFLWVFVFFLLFITVFTLDPVLIFISAALIIVIGAYVLEKRGL
jgi:hypothetical protein